MAAAAGMDAPARRRTATCCSSAAALRRLAERWHDGAPRMKDEYEQRARELDASADVLRALLAGAPA